MCLYLCITFIFSLSPALNRTSALNWPLNAAHSVTGSLSYKCRETKRAQAASKRVGDISGFQSSKHYLLLYFLFENNYTVYKFIYICVCIYFCRESPLSEKSRGWGLCLTCDSEIWTVFTPLSAALPCDWTRCCASCTLNSTPMANLCVQRAGRWPRWPCECLHMGVRGTWKSHPILHLTLLPSSLLQVVSL